MGYQRINITSDLLEEEPKAAQPVQEAQTKTSTNNNLQRGQRALNIAVDKVLAAPDGTKHTTLVKMSYLLGGYVGAGEITEAEAIKAMQEAISKRANVVSLKEANQAIIKSIQEGKNSPVQDDTNSYNITQLKPVQQHPPKPLLPPPELQELTPNERYHRLQQFRFSSDKPVPKPHPVISIDEHIIATPGNIITFVGQAKSGKSGIVAAILTGVLALAGETVDTLGFTVERNEQQRAIIHIDSEQASFNHYSGMMKVLKRAGRRNGPEWFHSYSFKSIDISVRMKALRDLFDELSKMHGGIHLAVIDGGADFVLDTNDLKESNAAIKAFEDLATEYNCAIVMILHFNPGSEKGRGHFGSQLERKSESVISVSRDEASEISTIKGKLLRNSGNIPNLQFMFDVNLGHHVYCGTLTRTSKAETKLFHLRELAQAIFEDGLTQYTYTKLWERIAEAEQVRERAAQNRIQAMLQSNLITKTDETEPIY